MALGAPLQLGSDDHCRALVREVVAAGDEDETDWIERKSHLDLGLKQSKSTIAKNILGFANRDPENRNDGCGGAGVIFIGARACSAESQCSTRRR